MYKNKPKIISMSMSISLFSTQPDVCLSLSIYNLYMHHKPRVYSDSKDIFVITLNDNLSANIYYGIIPRLK